MIEKRFTLFIFANFALCKSGFSLDIEAVTFS